MAEDKMTDTKGKYEILQNEKGEILIILQSRLGGPEQPLFVYDGTAEALLYRTSENTIHFTDIAAGARAPLKAVTELQIVELVDDDVIREYKVPVRLVKDVASLLA